MGLNLLVKLFCESAYSHNVWGFAEKYLSTKRFTSKNIKINRQIFKLKLIFKVKQMGKEIQFISCVKTEEYSLD